MIFVLCGILVPFFIVLSETIQQAIFFFSAIPGFLLVLCFIFKVFSVILPLVFVKAGFPPIGIILHEHH